jgi:hypothetical protein
MSPEQQAKVEKLLSNLEFLGFKKEFHEANIVKAVTEGKESFSLKDTSFSKLINFEILVSTNSKGNLKHEIRGEHKDNGNKVIMPFKNAYLSKSAIEGFLNGGWPLLRNHNVYGKEKVEINGHMVNPVIRTDSSFINMKEKPAKNWEEAKNLSAHVKTHNIKFFTLQENYFGHVFTNQDKAQLFNGHKLDASTVNLQTGEKQIAKGLRINFPVDENGKATPKLSYDSIEPTGQFLSESELEAVKASVKKKVAPNTNEATSEENTEEQSNDQKKKKSSRKSIA